MSRIVIARCLDCRRLLIERRPWRDEKGRVLCDRCVGLRKESGA